MRSRMLNHYTEKFTCPERYAALSHHPFSDSHTHVRFGVTVAVPPSNDIDIFANDAGFIAIMDEKGELAGFNITAGGGMGVTHGNKKTYP